MPELDTVRGVAVTGVVVLHAFAATYGYEGFHGMMRLFMRVTVAGKLGVNLFFVLSGFLITGILLSGRNKGRYYRRFYWRRVLRIFPPYFVTILIILLSTGAWKFALLSSIFLANLTMLFGVTSAYGVLWSLAVEEHFYLIWPTVVRKIRKRFIALTALLICIVVPLLRYHTGGVTPQTLLHATWYHCDGLALGAFLRICMERWQNRGLWRIVAGMAFVLGSAGILGLGLKGYAEEKFAIGFALQSSFWNVALAGLMVTMLLLGTGPLHRLATPRLLVFLGYISYGLYLYHLMIFISFSRIFPNANMFVRLAVAAPLSVLVSWLSRKYFEERFLKLKDWIEQNKQQRVESLAAATD